MPKEVQLAVINILRIIFFSGFFIFIVVIVSVILDKVTHRDYSDQTGIKNFRQFALGLSIVFIILLILGYALFLGIAI